MRESVFFVLIYSVVSIRNSCTLVRLLLVFFSSFFPSSLIIFVWVRIYKSKKYEGETSSEKMVAPAASLIDDIAAAKIAAIAPGLEFVLLTPDGYTRTT